MHLSLFFYALLVAFAVAETSSDSETSTTSTSTALTTTLVWVTGTNNEGVTVTTESAYTQTFASFYTSVSSPESGSIGIGSISGTVGEIRTYSRTTVNGANVLVSAKASTGFLAYLATFISVLFGIFSL